MQGQSFYDQNGCLVFPDEIGTKPSQAVTGSMQRPVTRPITRTPLTSRFRRMGGGSPAGALDSIKTWWGSLSKEWRWGVLGGIGVLAVITAAMGKKEGKGTWLKEI